MIVTLLGQAMEAMLVTECSVFDNYAKSLSHKLDKSLRSPPNTYNYTECGRFLMRSQIDCSDPRLPGTGTFDLKTRSACAVRHDMDYAQIFDGSDYQIKQREGLYESFSREYYDLIRSALFKYSLQARIGRMDGIFVAYHNIRTLFGFEYLPLAEIDKIYHTGHLVVKTKKNIPLGLDAEMARIAPLIADNEFKLSVNLSADLFDIILDKLPEEARKGCINVIMQAITPDTIIVFVKPMPGNPLSMEEAIVTPPPDAGNYVPYKDSYTLATHAKFNESFYPPDVVCLSVKLGSYINGASVPPRKFPSLSEESDFWSVKMRVKQLSESAALPFYRSVMSRMEKASLSTLPLTEHPKDLEDHIQRSMAKLSRPSKLQLTLRSLGEQGSKYRKWDQQREKTWH